MTQLTKSLPLHPKVAGATGGTAAVAAFAVILNAAGVHIDAGVIAAAETLATSRAAGSPLRPITRQRSPPHSRQAKTATTNQPAAR